VFTNTSDSVIWTLRTQSPVNHIAVFRYKDATQCLIVAAAPYLIALNARGRILWQLSIAKSTTQPITWLEVGNFDPCPGDEIIAVAGYMLFVILPTGKIINKFILPLLPKQIEISNIDSDLYDEIVVSDFMNLVALDANGDTEYNLTLAQTNPEINRGFDLYDFTGDQAKEIVTITQTQLDSLQSEIENRVCCFSTDGKLLWQSQEHVGKPRALRIIRGEIYTIGTSVLGPEYITKRDRTGKVLKITYYSNDVLPELYCSPEASTNQNPDDFQELYALGNLLLVGRGSSSELKSPMITSLRLFAPTLDEITCSSPEYISNLRIGTSDRNRRLFGLSIGSLNGDTLPDILLVREQKQGKYTIDCLINRADVLSRAEREIWNGYRSALAAGDRNLAVRLKRRGQILASSYGNTIFAARTESSIYRELRNRLRITLVRTLLITALIISLIFGFSIVVVRPMMRKRTWRLAQVESKSVPTVVRIATDIITLDHNYVVKGNLGGAYNRLKEITNKYGLNEDQDIRLVLRKGVTLDSLAFSKLHPDDFKIPYHRFIKRLTKESRTTNLLAVIKKICYNVLGAKTQISELTLNRSEYVPDRVFEGNRLGASNLSVSFLYLVNLDFPEIFNTSRLFWDARLYNWFEHICTDHLRYAKNYAHFVFDYETATEWSRKFVLHLVSDSKEKINFNRKDLHLVSEFEQLKTDYQDYILMSDNESVLYYPCEKIWVKIIDLISILSSIIGLNRGA
jgi:hypothetical protein